MPLIIDTMGITELDSVFKMACLMLFCDNYKKALHLPSFSSRNEHLMFHSPMSVPLSVSCLSSQQPTVETQGRVIRPLHFGPTE